MSGFLFQFSEGEVGSMLTTIDADTLEEASKEIDRYIEEHPYDYYVNKYKDGKYIIDLYEYEIKNHWTVEEDND